MKIILIIIFSFFPFLVIAEDISDFQIEGISVGDSLLDFMSEKEILKEIETNKDRYIFLEDKFTFVEVFKFQDLKTYDSISFFIKPDDEKFIIYSVKGSIDYSDDFKECIKKQNEIVNEISEMLRFAKKDEGTYNHRADVTNRSVVKFVRFRYESGEHILIQCYDFEENLKIKNDWTEPLSIAIDTVELIKWFRP